MVAGTTAEVAVAYVACGDDGAIVTYQATTVAGAGYFAVGGVTAGQSNISLRGFLPLTAQPVALQRETVVPLAQPPIRLPVLLLLFIFFTRASFMWRL